MMEIVKK